MKWIILVAVVVIAAASIYVLPTIYGNKLASAINCDQQQLDGKDNPSCDYRNDLATKDDSVAQNYASAYIKAYESYDPGNDKVNTEKVRLMSSPNVYRNFRKIKKETKTDVDVSSIQISKEAKRYIVTAVVKASGTNQYSKKIKLTATFNNSLVLTPEELPINPDKFVVIAYIEEQ